MTAARRYLSFSPRSGYPAGPLIHYECVSCGATVPSMPRHDQPYRCDCRNIVVDADAGRVSVKDDSAIRAFTIDPPS